MVGNNLTSSIFSIFYPLIGRDKSETAAMWKSHWKLLPKETRTLRHSCSNCEKIWDQRKSSWSDSPTRFNGFLSESWKRMEMMDANIMIATAIMIIENYDIDNNEEENACYHQGERREKREKRARKWEVSIHWRWRWLHWLDTGGLRWWTQLDIMLPLLDTTWHCCCYYWPMQNTTSPLLDTGWPSWTLYGTPVTTEWADAAATSGEAAAISQRFLILVAGTALHRAICVGRTADWEKLGFSQRKEGLRSKSNFLGNSSSSKAGDLCLAQHRLVSIHLRTGECLYFHLYLGCVIVLSFVFERHSFEADVGTGDCWPPDVPPCRECSVTRGRTMNKCNLNQRHQFKIQKHIFM